MSNLLSSLLLDWWLPAYPFSPKYDHQQHKTWREDDEELKEKLTKRADKEVYLMVDSILVKVKLSASSRELFGKEACFSCAVTEIDFKTVSPEEQKAGEKVFKSESENPSRQDEIGLLMQTLRHFGITGTPVPVSDDYVANHKRVVQLKNRIRKS